jgi:thiosulfate dehydrogenase
MKKQYLVLMGIIVIIGVYYVVGFIAGDYFKIESTIASTDSTWVGPSLYIDHSILGEERALIIYGQDLIAHTSKYLGPK